MTCFYFRSSKCLIIYLTLIIFSLIILQHPLLYCTDVKSSVVEYLLVGGNLLLPKCLTIHSQPLQYSLFNYILAICRKHLTIELYIVVLALHSFVFKSSIMYYIIIYFFSQVFPSAGSVRRSIYTLYFDYVFLVCPTGTLYISMSGAYEDSFLERMGLYFSLYISVFFAGSEERCLTGWGAQAGQEPLVFHTVWCSTQNVVFRPVLMNRCSARWRAPYRF